MASGTASAQVRVPLGDLVFPPAPPPTYAHTILLGEKISSGGLKTIRRRNNYPERAPMDQKFEKKMQKLSHSAENTLFHIFIH